MTGAQAHETAPKTSGLEGKEPVKMPALSRFSEKQRDCSMHFTSRNNQEMQIFMNRAALKANSACTRATAGPGRAHRRPAEKARAGESVSFVCKLLPVPNEHLKSVQIKLRIGNYISPLIVTYANVLFQLYK